jgi:hypothetical protein
MSIVTYTCDNCCQKWGGLERIAFIKLLDSRLHCVVTLPHYENGTNDGTSGSHHRKDKCISKINESRNVSWPTTSERRNAGQIRCPSRQDDGQVELPARVNGGLSRKDGGHGFGGKCRRNRVLG